MNTRTRSTTRTFYASRRSLRSQRGWAMMEIGLGLIVIGLISLGAFLLFSDSQRSVELEQNTQAITRTVANLQSKFGKTNTYGSVSTAIAVQSEAIPKILRRGSAATAENSYGGSITVAAAKCINDDDCATLSWASVPKAQCFDLVVGASRAVRKVVVGSTTVKALDAALDIETLGTTCDGAASHTIAFTIGRGA